MIMIIKIDAGCFSFEFNVTGFCLTCKAKAVVVQEYMSYRHR